VLALTVLCAMFKLDLSPTYWATVTFNTPSADGQRRVTHTFDAEFPRMTADELQAFGKRCEADKLEDPAAARLILRNFRGIQTASGDELPFSETHRDLVLNQAGVAYAVLRKFHDSQPKAGAGN
jgi:hypothetical protein